MANEAKKLLERIVGTKDETPNDIVKFMKDYAKSMRKRHREAAEGDKYLPCSSVALRMEDTATRLKAALRRERAGWREKLRQAKG